MKAVLSPILPLALRLLLGITLLWAGVAKIPEPGLFAQTVRAYGVLPLPLINPFAVVVPWMEVTTGLCLVLGFWTRSSALSALLLLLCFGVALGVNLHRGADLSCGCFGLDGADGSLSGALIRDILLIAVALLLLLARSVPPSLDPFLQHRTPSHSHAESGGVPDLEPVARLWDRSSPHRGSKIVRMCSGGDGASPL